MRDERLDSVDATVKRPTMAYAETCAAVRRIADGLIATNERMDRGLAETESSSAR